METQILQIINDVITLIGTIIVAYLGNKHFTAKQVDTAKSLAELAVSFAEEAARTTGIKGGAKLTTALSFVQSRGEKLGIKLTEDQWAAEIKAVLNQTRALYDSYKGEAEPHPMPDPVPPAVAEAPPESATAAEVPVPENIKPVLDTAKASWNQTLMSATDAINAQIKP